MIKEVKSGNYEYINEDKVTENGFSFFTDLTPSKKVNFVATVVGTIVDANGYNKILLDMIFDFTIVNIFTDIDITEIEESANVIDAIEEFLNCTNVVKIVKANAKEGLIESLYDAVLSDIEYKTGVHSINPFYSSLSGLLNVITEKFKDVNIEEFVEVARKFNEGTGTLTPERMLEAYANTDYLKNKIAHDLEQKKKNDTVIETLVKDSRIENKN